jgi:hypothetical protein
MFVLNVSMFLSLFCMVSRLYLDPILTGWVAFALSVVLFLLVIAWYFKSEADKARHELVSSKIYNSETASLITRRNIRRLNSSVMTQYHQICSDDEIEEEDELDVNPKPLVPQPPSHRFHFRSTTSRRYVNRPLHEGNLLDPSPDGHQIIQKCPNRIFRNM